MSVPPPPTPPSPSSPERTAAHAVQRCLREAGFVAYFAGGCVRDELLGVAPSDYDVATDATPQEIEKLFRRTAHVGAHFGVVLVKQGEVVIEVATFRSDGAYSDSRRPDSVRFSSPMEDAQRRDYTVNALFLDPDASTSAAPNSARTIATPGGLLIDFVGGLEDLRGRVLRAVGDPEARLREDNLRALRGVRLAAKLGFAIEPATARAITTHARELRGVSAERIGGEVLAMLAHPARAHAAELLRDLELAPAILAAQPGWESGWSLAPGEPALHLRGLAPHAPIGVAIAAWLLDMGVGVREGSGGATSPSTHTQYLHAARALRAALCLSNADREAMLHALEGRLELRTRWGVMETAARKRCIAGPRWAGGLALLGASEPQVAQNLQDAAQLLAQDGIGIEPAPLVTGDDLVLIGIRPGPAYKAILDTLYDAQLAGTLTTKAAGLTQSRELAARLGV